MSELAFTTLTALSANMRNRTISPVTVTQHMLDRIAALDGRLHAYVTVLPEQALTQARAAETEIANGHYRGFMHGIPIALKEYGPFRELLDFASGKRAEEYARA